MIGPGCDSGSTALITDAYDALMAEVCLPLHGAIVIPVTENGERIPPYLFRYRITKPDAAMRAISDVPFTRLYPLMGALRCATAVVESNGLECA